MRVPVAFRMAQPAWHAAAVPLNFLGDLMPYWRYLVKRCSPAQLRRANKHGCFAMPHNKLAELRDATFVSGYVVVHCCGVNCSTMAGVTAITP